MLAPAALLCTTAIHGTIAGKVVDALTGRPVRGAVVSDGKLAATLTDRQGAFELEGLSGAAIDVIVQHPEYLIFAQPKVPVGTRVEIKLQPTSIQAEPIEIVETREEDLRPMLRAQAPFNFPFKFSFLHHGEVMKGLYRVCVAKDGHISLVAALEPAADADPYVKEGIAQGWEYKPLSKPACFTWRVTLRFNLKRSVIRPNTSVDQSVPLGPELQPK